MKTMQFTYKKDSGETSKRKVAVIAKPSNNFLTLDLSDLTEAEALAVVEKYQQAHQKFQAELKALGVASRYKAFKSNNIISQ